MRPKGGAFFPPTGGTFTPEQVMTDPRFPRDRLLPVAIPKREGGPPHLVPFRRDRRPGDSRGEGTRWFDRHIAGNQITWGAFSDWMTRLGLVAWIDGYGTVRLANSPDRREGIGRADAIDANSRNPVAD